MNRSDLTLTLSVLICVVVALVVGVGIGQSLQRWNTVLVRVPEGETGKTTKIDCYVRWHKDIQGK